MEKGQESESHPGLTRRRTGRKPGRRPGFLSLPDESLRGRSFPGTRQQGADQTVSVLEAPCLRPPLGHSPARLLTDTVLQVAVQGERSGVYTPGHVPLRLVPTPLRRHDPPSGKTVGKERSFTRDLFGPLHPCPPSWTLSR